MTPVWVVVLFGTVNIKFGENIEQVLLNIRKKTSDRFNLFASNLEV